MAARRYSVLVLILLAGASPPTTTQPARELRLDAVTSGVSDRLGYYVLQNLEFTDQAPPTLIQSPANLLHPLYAILPIGNKSLGRVIHVILTGGEPGAPGSAIYVDTHGDGRLSDAAPTAWRKQSFINGDGKPFTTFASSAAVDIGPPGAPFLATVIFMAGNGNDATITSALSGQPPRLFYHGDYARAGRVMIGNKNYDVLLEDKFTTGDFSGQTPPQPPHQADNPIRFLIDRGGTGHFSATDKFNAFASFAIDGVTYALSDITPSGDRLILGPSIAAVKELPVPPDLSAGKTVPPFVATTIDGKVIHFPADYKGKIVALDFWATWCGPCLIEAPRLAAASATYSSHGLAVLGVSLDNPRDLSKLRDYAQKQQMAWPEIFDGKMWDSDLVMSYGLSSIPSIFLVDGDTGVVLSTPEQMTPDGLMGEIEKAMGRKGLRPKTRSALP